MRLLLIIHIILFGFINSFSQTELPDFNGQILWLRADSVIMNNDSTVSEWIDLSPMHNSVFQTDNAHQAKFTDSLIDINKKPAIKFSGNQWLNGGDICDMSNDGITIFIVGKTINSNGSFVAKSLAGAQKKRYANLYSNNEFEYLFHSSVENNLTASSPVDSFLYFTSVTNFSVLKNHFFKNGLVLDSTPIANYDMNSDFDFLVGTYNNSQGTVPPYSNLNLNGDIAEIIVYNRPLSFNEKYYVENYLRYKYFPDTYQSPVNLVNNIYIPYGFCDTIIDAGARFANYIWSTGDTTQTISTNKTGQYSVTVTDIFGFQSSDTVMVYFPKMNIALSDTLICFGDTIEWDAGLQNTNYTFVWQNSNTDSIHSVFSVGDYYVQITDTFGCFFKSDTAKVTIDNYPITTSLGNDTSLCAGQNLYLKNGISETVNYIWSTGSVNDNITIASAGEYSVTTTNIIGCVATDTINIQIHGNAPVPGFYYTKTCFNDLTQFNDTSYSSDASNIINWHWDFGNGDTSIIQNPNLQYLDTGNYNVTLTIITDNTCENTITKNIRINPLPIAAYTNTQLCEKNNIQFTNTSIVPLGNITNSLWIFGNGDTSIQTNPIYQYNNYGNYNLQLQVISNNGCKDTLIQNIEIKPSPETDFNFGYTCKTNIVDFYNTTQTLSSNPVSEYKWDFGDGTTSTNENENHLFDINDTLNTVSLYAKTTNGCSYIASKQVTMHNLPQVAIITDGICQKNNTTLYENCSIENDIIISYYWQVNNNNYNEQNPIIYFNDTGLVNLTLTATSSNGCADSTTKQIPIHKLPNPDFIINPEYGTINNATSFIPTDTVGNIWDFGNGSSSTASIGHTTYFNNDIYMVNHYSIDQYNCIDSVSKKYLVVIPPNISNIQGQILWLDADTILMNIADSTVYEWNDLSPNQTSVFQNEHTNQPKFIDSVLNNKPVIRFNGNQWLNGGDICDMSNDGITIFIVGKTINSNGSFVAKSLAGAQKKRYANLYSNNEFEYLFHSSVENNLTASSPVDSFLYFTSVTNFSVLKNHFFKNGLVLDSTPIANYDMNSDFDFLVGTYNNSQGTVPPYSNLNLNGDIAEIIVYNRPLSFNEKYYVENYLRYKYFPDTYQSPVNLVNNIYIPYGFCDTIIDAGARFANYIWSTGDTTQTISTNKTGQYSVTVTDIFGFQSSDTVMVYFPKMNIALSDTLICFGDTIEWDAGLQNTNYTFVWQNSNTDSIHSVFSVGDYYVQITDTFGCFFKSDTAKVTIDNYPITTSLGNDTSLCAGQNLYLKNGISETVNYIWSTGSVNDNITIASAGEYSVTTTNIIGCVATDTINIQTHGNAPVPDFDIANICFTDNTIFTNTSYTTDNSNIILWQWNFGNGETSTMQNPQMQFADTGIFTISLNILTDSNCTNLIMKNVEIHSLPVSNYTNTQLCQENNIHFTNLSTIPKGNIISYYWNFGNGDTSITKHPTYLYNNYGYYNLQLISTSDFNCKDTLNKTIEIKPNSVADFLTGATCKDEIIHFYDHSTSLPYNPIIQVFWDFGNGSTSDVKNPSIIFYNNDTLCNILFKIKSINGCRDSVTKQIQLYNTPNAFFINDKICAKTLTQLTNNSSIVNDTIISNVWQIDNDFYYDKNPTVIFKKAGLTNIFLTTTSSHGCTDKYSRHNSILELPNPNFDIIPQWGITNEYTVFTSKNLGSNFWDFGNGNIGTDSVVYTVYPDSGIYIIEHIVVDSNNCVDTIYENYRVVIPQNDIAITDVRYSINNNILSIETDIINIGNLPASKIKFTLSPDKYSSISEIWEGELMYGAGITYTFNATYSIYDNKIPEHICVIADILNKYIDVNPSNNTYCTSENSFMLYPIYPNPTHDFINISFKLDRNADVTINMYDNQGKLIANINNKNYDKGFHKMTYNVSKLAKASYTIKISIDNKTETTKFIKK